MLVAWGASGSTSWSGSSLPRATDSTATWRARHGTTRSGAFLDPLADKAVVLGVLITLAAQGHLPWLPVVLIAAREVGMQLYRSWVGRRGVSIPARNSAKLKTLVQDIAVGACIIPPLADQHDLQTAMIWFAWRSRSTPGASTSSTDGGAPRAIHPVRSPTVRIEIVAVGTELLLGQIADTNSAWLGEHLAPSAWLRTSTRQWATTMIASRLRCAPRWPAATAPSCAAASGRPRTTSPARPLPRSWTSRSSATRRSSITSRPSSKRGRTMPENNVRQADVPGGRHRDPSGGGHRARPDLSRRQQGRLRGARCALRNERDVRRVASSPTCGPAWPRPARRRVIASRVLRTWGSSESGTGRDAPGPRGRARRRGATSTLAFLASGIEGIKVRITARARLLDDVTALLDKEETGCGAPSANGWVTSSSASTTRRWRWPLPAAHCGRVEFCRGRVTHRWSHRVASRQRAGRVGLVQGRCRGLRLAGQVRRPRCPARTGGERAGRRRHGRGWPACGSRRRARDHRRGGSRRPGGRGFGHRVRRTHPARPAHPDPGAPRAGGP